MTSKEYKAHVYKSLNPRAEKRFLSEDYNSPGKVHKRETERISKAKRIRDNKIENLKTKKKHP